MLSIEKFQSNIYFTALFLRSLRKPGQVCLCLGVGGDRKRMRPYLSCYPHLLCCLCSSGIRAGMKERKVLSKWLLMVNLPLCLARGPLWPPLPLSVTCWLPQGEHLWILGMEFQRFLPDIHRVSASSSWPHACARWSLHAPFPLDQWVAPGRGQRLQKA